MEKEQNDESNLVDELIKKFMEIYNSPLNFLNFLDTIPGENKKKISENYKKLLSRKQYYDQIIEEGWINKILVKFYENASSSNWKLYKSIFDDIGICPFAEFIPLKDKKIDLKYDDELFKMYIDESIYHQNKKKYDKIIRENKVKQVALELSGTNLWDSPVYTIRDICATERPQFILSLCSYLAYRLSIGEIQDEIADYIVSKVQRGESFKEIFDNFVAHDLQTRLKFGKNIDEFCDFTKRDVPIGMNALLAFKRKKDYLLVIQKRSRTLSEAPGGYAVLPAAIHQHIIDVDKEKHLLNTLWREIYEELFGGEEVSGKTRHISHDWYFKDFPPLEELRRQATVSFTGAGVNLANGFFDISILVIIPDENFFENYCHKMKTSWESSDIDNPIISTAEPEKIKSILRRDNWLANSRIGLEQGLLKLNSLDKDRCKKIDSNK